MAHQFIHCTTQVTSSITWNTSDWSESRKEMIIKKRYKIWANVTGIIKHWIKSLCCISYQEDQHFFVSAWQADNLEIEALWRAYQRVYMPQMHPILECSDKGHWTHWEVRQALLLLMAPGTNIIVCVVGKHWGFLNLAWWLYNNHYLIISLGEEVPDIN